MAGTFDLELNKVIDRGSAGHFPIFLHQMVLRQVDGFGQGVEIQLFMNPRLHQAVDFLQIEFTARLLLPGDRL